MNLNFFCLKSYQPTTADSLASVISNSLLTASFQLPSRLLKTYPLNSQGIVEHVVIVQGSQNTEFVTVGDKSATAWRLNGEELQQIGSWPIWAGVPLLCLKCEGLLLVTDKFIGFVGQTEQPLNTAAVFDWEINNDGPCLLVYTSEGSLLKVHIGGQRLNPEVIGQHPTLQSALLWNSDVLIKDFLTADICMASTGRCLVRLLRPEDVQHISRHPKGFLVLLKDELQLYSLSDGVFKLCTSLRLTRSVNEILHVDDELISLKASDGRSLLVTLGAPPRELIWQLGSLYPGGRTPLHVLSIATDKAELISCGAHRQALLQNFYFPELSVSREAPCKPIVFIRRFSELLAVLYCCCSDGTFFSIGIDRNDTTAFYGEMVFKLNALAQPLEVVENQNNERSLLYLNQSGAIVLTDISKSTELVIVEAAVKPIRTAYCSESGILFIAHSQQIQRFDCRQRIKSPPLQFENPITALDISGDKLLVGDSRMSVHLYQIKAEHDDYLKYVCGDYSGRCVSFAHFVEDSHLFAIVDSSSCVFLPLRPTTMLRVDPLSAQVYPVRSPLPLAENALREEIKYRHHCGLVNFFNLGPALVQGMRPEVAPGALTATLCGVLVDCQGNLYLVTNNRMDPAQPDTSQTLTTLFHSRRAQIKWIDNVDIRVSSLGF